MGLASHRSDRGCGIEEGEYTPLSGWTIVRAPSAFPLYTHHPPSLFHLLSLPADWYLRDISHNINTRLSLRNSPSLLLSSATLLVGVAWIHYTNYIDDTSMGHEIGGRFGCTDSAGTIFHAVPSRLTLPLTLSSLTSARTFVSFFPLRANEENNVAPAVLIMMQMIAFQYSRER